MPSNDFLMTARRIIRENPDVFEALLEFERTKRVPKLNHKQRIDVTVDEDVVRRFREACAKKGVPLSRCIEKLMVERLQQN